MLHVTCIVICSDYELSHHHTCYVSAFTVERRYGPKKINQCNYFAANILAVRVGY